MSITNDFIIKKMRRKCTLTLAILLLQHPAKGWSADNIRSFHWHTRYGNINDEHLNPASVRHLVDEARKQEELGDFVGALAIWRRVLYWSEFNLGQNHPGTGDALNNIGSLLRILSKYKESEAILNRSLQISENALGPTDASVANSLISLALLYQDLDLYLKSEQLLRRSLEIRKKTFGVGDIQTTEVLELLSGNLYHQNQYNKAIAMLEYCLEVQKKILNKDDPKILTTLNNLGLYYQKQGNYSKSLELYTQSMAGREKLLGPNHPSTAATINNLASLYAEMGRMEEALTYFRRVLQTHYKIYGAKHPKTALVLNNIAAIYSDQGQYSSALEYYLNSIEMEGGAARESNPAIATYIENLAVLYMNAGLYEKAFPLLFRSLEIRIKFLGRNNLDVAASQASIGNYYLHIRNLKKAELYLKASVELQTKLLGNNHPVTSQGISNLALLYQLKGDYPQAEKLYKQSLSKQKQFGDKNAQALDQSMVGLGILYTAWHRYALAFHAFNKVFSDDSEWMRRELPLMPVSRRLQQIDVISDRVSIYSSFADKYGAAQLFNLEAVLNNKGLLQEIQNRQKLLVLSTNSQKNTLYRIQSIIKQISVISLSPARRSALANEQEDLERQLYRELPGLSIRKISIEEVAAALPDDGVLIEFQKYRSYDFKKAVNALGEERYVALLLKPDGHVNSIPLGVAKPIDDLILQSLMATAENANDSNELWSKVSKMILDPLKSSIIKNRQLFLVPDGELTRVPFAALPSPLKPTESVATSFQLRILTTGRELMSLQHQGKQGQAPLVMANPNYETNQSENNSSAYPYNAKLQMRSLEAKATHWSQLSATQYEGQKVASILGTNVIVGDRATAARLISSPAPIVMHVATHGFFLPDQHGKAVKKFRLNQDASQAIQDFTGTDPMLRSGLVFAGANQSNDNSEDDGYLTAAEATGLQLDGTELVVLSACSTAQGRVQNGEGVYGLQRALAVAGARSTLLSLWKVDDKATAEFMVRFYKRLKAGEPRSDALAAVQKEFRDGKTGIPGWSDPFYWAAWQLVGDWRPIKGL